MTIYEVSSTHGLDDYAGGSVAVGRLDEARRIRDNLQSEYSTKADWRENVTIDRVTIRYRGVDTIVACINGEKYAEKRVQVWPKKRGPSQAYMDKWSAENEEALQEAARKGGTSGDEI